MYLIKYLPTYLPERNKGKKEEYPSSITGRGNPPRHWDKLDITYVAFYQRLQCKTTVQWETLGRESDGFSQS